MPEIAVLVRLTAVEGKRDEALAVLGRLVDATESEPGTVQYTLASDVLDPSVIWFSELYADQAALEAHATTSTMAEVMGLLSGLVAGAAEMHQATVVRRKGAPSSV
jgi:quinol monooxygenase YgiN